MDEEFKELDDLKEDEENLNEEDTSKKQVKKTFTEDQVNKIVSDRVNREKSLAKTQMQSFTDEKLVLETTVSDYEKIINSFLEPLLEEQSDSVKKLLEKLSLKDKIEFLKDSSTTGNRKKTPSFPNNSNNGNPSAETKRKSIGI